MPTSRLAIFGSCLLMTVILGGWIHGSPPTLKGDTWKEALEQVPCEDVAKDGKDLKISGVILVVKGQPQPNPLVVTKKKI
jgi:hypothetical protein